MIPHILWITQHYPPDPGGMANSCARQTSGLRRRELRLDVLAFSEDLTEDKYRIVERDAGRDILIDRRLAPGNAAQLGWSLLQRQHAALPYSAAVGFGANQAGLAAVTYAAWLGLPSLIMVRGNDFDRDWFEPRLNFAVHSALSRAAFITAVAPDLERRIKALFPEKKVRFVPNGIDPEQWRLLVPEKTAGEELKQKLSADGRRVVGIFGEIKFKKWVPFWLQSLRAAGLKDKVSLLIVGRVDEETAQILNDPVLAPPHQQLEFSSRTSLPALYAACDFIALPSLFEGMPNVLLEAMALGVVPIAADAGAMGQVVEDGATGFLFPPDDLAAAMRANTRALALSDAELGFMSQKVKASIAQDFSAAKEIDLLYDIIVSL